MRLRLLVLLAMLGAAALPASALAVAPVNDSMGNALQLAPNYGTSATALVIPHTAPLGGWEDATSADDTALTPPSCFGSAGFHSMWYRLDVPESAVLTIGLSSGDVKYYRPLVQIFNTDGSEAACSLGGTSLIPGQAVFASSYVPKDSGYLIRIASAADTPSDDNTPLPDIQLTETLRDITPPTIHVTVSKIVGVRKAFTFDARGSVDKGSGIDTDSAVWSFFDAGTPTTVPGPLAIKHEWGSAGLHRVSLALSDKAGNKNTYQFNVLVHSFVPPKVRIRVLAPRRGARTMRVKLTHDMPVRVRLVVLQAGRKLRTIPSMTVKGFHKTNTISIPLTGKIARTGSVIVSGTASDLSTPPNTVALRTCSVRPGKAGGVCV